MPRPDKVAEEWWDGIDEPTFRPIRRSRPRKDDPEEDAADASAQPIPAEEGLEASVYRIPTVLWWFDAPNRRDRPGLCVRCDLTERIAVLCPGRDPGSRYSQGTVVLVDPTPENGLTKRTAFAMTPWTIDLRMLQLIHNDGQRMGRLAADVFDEILVHLAELWDSAPGDGQ